MEEEIEVKVVIVGRSQVGKTSVATVATQGDLLDQVLPTVAASFLLKDVTYNDTSITLQLWDTAGQEKYKSMTPLYFRGAKIAIVVFSLTDLQSFQDIDDWIKSVKASSEEETLFFIVGNKADLVNERQVNREQALYKAKQYQALYFETSAITKQGVNELFDAVGKAWYQNRHTKIPPIEKKEQNQQQLTPAQEKKGGCC